MLLMAINPLFMILADPHQFLWTSLIDLYILIKFIHSFLHTLRLFREDNNESRYFLVSYNFQYIKYSNFIEIYIELEFHNL